MANDYNGRVRRSRLCLSLLALSAPACQPTGITPLDAGVDAGRDALPFSVDLTASAPDATIDPVPADQDRDGYTVADGDCDDDDATVHPAGVEVCGDGIDQNCDGSDLACSAIDGDGDGYSPIQGDCDDEDPAISPGAKEIAYNGVDEDCDPSTPDDDLDQDGFNKLDGSDCDDSDNAGAPRRSRGALRQGRSELRRERPRRWRRQAGGDGSVAGGSPRSGTAPPVD